MSYGKPNFTQVPNLLLDEHMSEMSCAELKVTLVIVRKTIGWQKDTDSISLSQLEEATGLSRKSVLKGIQEAIERGTIKQGVSGRTSTYELVEPENDSGKSTPIEKTDRWKKYTIDSGKSTPIDSGKSTPTKERVLNKDINKLNNNNPRSNTLEQIQEQMLDADFRNKIEELQYKAPTLFPTFEDLCKQAKQFTFHQKNLKAQQILAILPTYGEQNILARAQESAFSVTNPQFVFKDLLDRLQKTQTTARRFFNEDQQVRNFN